jgi:hypothetical protein
MQNVAIQHPDVGIDDDELFPQLMAEEPASSPSPPAVLLSATFGICCIGLALYLCHWVLGFDLGSSAAMAGIVLILLFGPLGILASLLVGSAAVEQNVGYGCGLTLVTLAFFAVCALVGAMAAIFAVQVGLVTG